MRITFCNFPESQLWAATFEISPKIYVRIFLRQTTLKISPKIDAAIFRRVTTQGISPTCSLFSRQRQCRRNIVRRHNWNEKSSLLAAHACIYVYVYVYTLCATFVYGVFFLGLSGGLFHAMYSNCPMSSQCLVVVGHQCGGSVTTKCELGNLMTHCVQIFLIAT